MAAVAAVDEDPSTRFTSNLLPIAEPLEEVRSDCCAGLDLHWNRAARGYRHKVHFVAAMVPPEAQARLMTRVVARLPQFGHDEVLEHCASHRVHRELVGAPDVQQVAQQTGVYEVEFRTPRQPLSEVLVMGLQAKGDEARLQHGKPPARGLVAHPAVGADGREIQELSGAARAEEDETTKGLEVANLCEGPDVPLQIGLEVEGEPLRRAEPPIVDRRVASRNGNLGPLSRQRDRPAVADVLGRAQGKPLQLGRRERQQMRDVNPPGEALGDLTHEEKVVRSGKDVPARLGSFVDQHLDVGKQFRCMLDLIEDHRIAELGEEAARIRKSERPHVRRFKRCVAVIPEGVP